jgi:hypothetical protein
MIMHSLELTSLVSRWPAILQNGFRALVVCALIALTACSPTYDWREIQPADEPLALMLPGKPSALTRQINLDGVIVSMRMHGALVKESSFTAAWAELDESKVDINDRPAFRKKALDAMQVSMTRNIAGTVASREAVNVRLINETSQPVGQVPGERLTIRGTARGSAATLHGVFVSFGARVYQFVVIGENVPESEVKTFIESIQIRVAKPSAMAAR